MQNSVVVPLNVGAVHIPTSALPTAPLVNGIATYPRDAGGTSTFVCTRYYQGKDTWGKTSNSQQIKLNECTSNQLGKFKMKFFLQYLLIFGGYQYKHMRVPGTISEHTGLSIGQKVTVGLRQVHFSWQTFGWRAWFEVRAQISLGGGAFLVTFTNATNWIYTLHSGPFLMASQQTMVGFG